MGHSYPQAATGCNSCLAPLKKTRVETPRVKPRYPSMITEHSYDQRIVDAAGCTCLRAVAKGEIGKLQQGERVLIIHPLLKLKLDWGGRVIT